MEKIKIGEIKKIVAVISTLLILTVFPQKGFCEDLNLSHLEKIGTVQYQTETVTEEPEPKIEEYDERTCFICGFQAKTTTGLATHKRKKHNL